MNKPERLVDQSMFWPSERSRLAFQLSTTAYAYYDAWTAYQKRQFDRMMRGGGEVTPDELKVLHGLEEQVCAYAAGFQEYIWGQSYQGDAASLDPVSRVRSWQDAWQQFDEIVGSTKPEVSTTVYDMLDALVAWEHPEGYDMRRADRGFGQAADQAAWAFYCTVGSQLTRTLIQTQTSPGQS
ncbi:hypothetical protein E6P97_03305 [Patescibacteria group bacterium]|nr:MAG: hypothetical protein E6P97_03305 [Patescibacteria group bacterium]